MGRHKERRKHTASEVAVPLVVAALGIGAALYLFFSEGNYQPLEPALLAVAALFAALGFRENTLRALMSVGFAYIATGIAALTYLPLTPYVAAPFGDQITSWMHAFSYLVLTAVFWIVLESVGRALIRETSLPGLGFLDHLLALVIYGAIGIVVASLLFASSVYVAPFRRMHDAARLRPQFAQVVGALSASQSFLFRTPPGIYSYDSQ